MQNIILKNFRSYEHQSLTNLNSRINIIIGPNGKGKSNLFKGISFLLTNRSKLNNVEFNANLHRGKNPVDSEISVEATLKSSNEHSEKETYKVEKSWKLDNKENFLINEKTRSKAQFQDFVESFGFPFSNPYYIVQKEGISEITTMAENQLYLMLQEIAGVKKYTKREQQAKAILEKIEVDLSEVSKQLGFLKDQLHHVEGRKNQFQFFSVEQKTKKIVKKRELQNYVQTVRNKIAELKEEHHKVIKQVQERSAYQNQLNQQIEEKQMNIKILNEKAIYFEKEESDDSIGMVMGKNEIKKDLGEKKKQLKDLQKKIPDEQSKIKGISQKLDNLEKELSIYREKYELIKIDFDVQGQSKDLKKMKESYNVKKQSEQQNIKNVQQQIQKIQKMRKEFKPIPYQKQSGDLKQLDKEKETQTQKLRKNRISLIEYGRKKINLECEIQTLAGKKKIIEDQLKKALPNLDFKLLSFIEQNKIKGVYGYLLSHLKINENVQFAYELAGMPKLCTLLVEDENVAAKIVELNKSLKGRNINILPLSFVKEQIKQKRAYPKMDNVESLLNEEWIKYNFPKNMSTDVKSSIQKVVNNTFAKYMLVEDFSVGLKVSKQYSVNCITANKQIVYADAYMCKVGRSQTYDKGKIELFEIFETLSKQVSEAKASLEQTERKEIEFQNQEIENINKKEQLDTKISQVTKTIENGKKIEQIIEKLQIKKVSLDKLIERSQFNIKQIEKSLQSLQNNSQPKFKVQDLRKAEGQYFSHKTIFDNLYNQKYEKEKTLINLLRHKQDLEKQVSQLQKGSGDMQSKLQIQEQIKRKIDSQFDGLASLNQKIGQFLQKKVQLQQRKLTLFAHITVEQQNQKQVADKLGALADVDENEQDDLEELSRSISLKFSQINTDSMKNKFRYAYTVRDKLFFDKITDYSQKVQAYVARTEELAKYKKKLEIYIQKTGKSAKKYMQNFISDFEKYFIQYFLKIAPKGKADLRTKIYTHNIKGINKNGYSLEIKVSFGSDEGVKRWSQFSGGQKAVLAFCIVFAIQKTSPTPFFILDEFDAAIDEFYSEPIMKILAQQSENSQIFITSFKKNMLNFPETIANYYLVGLDGSSAITQVSKEHAENAIKGFIA